MKSNYLLATAIIQKNDKFLLLQRSLRSKHYQLCWQFPGGKVQPLEQPQKTIKREIHEELNCNIVNIVTKGEIKFTISIIFFKIKVTEHLFKIKISSKITLSPEHRRYAWFTKDEILQKKNIIPGTREVLMKVQ